MPSLSVTYNPIIGPLLTLILTPPAVLARGMHAVAQTDVSATPLNVHAALALVDTGASITSVTEDLARTVGLPLIGKRLIGTASGAWAANIYLADIAIPFSNLPVGPPGQPLPATNVTAAPMLNIPVLEFKTSSPRFNMLLGRDILCRGIFSMGFDGRITFSL